MQTKLDPKIILFFVILAIAQIYMIGAFGSVESSHGHPASEFRNISRYLILIASIAGLVLLPTKRLGSFPIPKLPLLFLIPLAILLAWGLLNIINAKADQRVFEFIVRPKKNILWEWGPGTETSTTTRGFIAELAIMITFVLMIAKSTQSSAWKGILGSFVICGVLVTIVGMGHKMLGMKYIYGLEEIKGRDVVELPSLYFAPFIYNANAASFLNLAVAMSLGLAFHTHRSKPGSPFFPVWLVSAAICSIGVIEAASKAGVLLLFFQLGLFFLCEIRYVWKSFKNRQKGGSTASLEKKMAIGIVVVVLLVFAAASASKVVSRFDHLVERSQSEKGSTTVGGRALMRELMWDVIADQEKLGWRGQGPGSFAHFMPYMISEKEHAEMINEHWHYAHCDPLQTIFEWGYLGAACWFFIGVGALGRSIYLAWTGKEGSSNAHIFMALSIGIITLSIHSTYDFPFSILSIHTTSFACLAIMWTLKNSDSRRSKMSS